MDYEKWLQAFKETDIVPEFYTSRKREYTEVLPWEHIDFGVNKKFLISENRLAHNEVTTKNCREECAACGAICFGEGVCFEKR